MSEHTQIYLAPACHEVDREWCQDDVWGTCEDCGEQSVRYVLASENDKRVAELEEELAGAYDLIRFLAQLYCQLDRLRYETIKLPEGEIVDYMINKWPVVQGTANQIRLMRLSEMPYDSSKLPAAVNACLARHGGQS